MLEVPIHTLSESICAIFQAKQSVGTHTAMPAAQTPIQNTGYIVSFLVYQIGTFATTGVAGTAFVQGIIAVSAIIALIVFIGIRTRKKIDKEFAVSK